MKKNNNEEQRRGIIIAFIGQDGAGKTTISNIMSEKLKKDNKVENMYLGSGENYSSLLKKLHKYLEKHSNFTIINELFGMIFYIKIAKRCSIQMKLAKEKAKDGAIILLDRCPQIQFEGINDGPKIESKYKNSTSKFINKIYPYFRKKEIKYLKQAVNVPPDIVVKLQLTVEESMRRKPDNDINKLRIKHQITDKLKFPKSKVIEIDATQPLNQEISEIFSNLKEFTVNGDRDNERQKFLNQIRYTDCQIQMNLNDNDKNDKIEEKEYDILI